MSDTPGDGGSDELRTSERIEDRRWAAGERRRDWGILGVMVAVYAAIHLFVFFLEPGIR